MPLLLLLVAMAVLSFVVVPGIYLFALYVLFPLVLLCVAAFVAWLIFPPVRDYWNEARKRINIERPEYWAVGIGAILAVAIIFIQRQADSFEWGNFKNCLYFRSPCDFPAVPVLWFVFAHAFAILGALGAGAFFELKGLYPPKSDPVRHLTAYVVLALSALIIVLNWPRLSLILGMFVGLPVAARFLYVQSKKEAALSVAQQLIERQTAAFPSEEEFVARVMKDL
jgi:hypothetical protein